MSLNTFKRTEIIQSVFFDHNGTKLEINTRIIMVKSPHTWKLNNTVLNDPYINKEVLAKKKKKDIEPSENKNATCQNLWDTKQCIYALK